MAYLRWWDKAGWLPVGSYIGSGEKNLFFPLETRYGQVNKFPDPPIIIYLFYYQKVLLWNISHIQESIENSVREWSCEHHIALFSLKVSSYLLHILFSQKKEHPMGSVKVLHEPSPSHSSVFLFRNMAIMVLVFLILMYPCTLLFMYPVSSNSL